MDRPRGELWRARASEQGSLFQAQTVGLISLDRARKGSALGRIDTRVHIIMNSY